MEHYEDRFDFHGLGLAIKDAREKRGWTQEYLAELVGRTSHTIMNIENKGSIRVLVFSSNSSACLIFPWTSSYTVTAGIKKAFAASILMCCLTP